jgi:transposase
MNHQPTSSFSKCYIGIDVSRDWLDISGLESQLRRMANDAGGHARLLKQLPVDCHIVLEASGGYEQALWLALLRAGKAVSRVHPGRVRHFAKANLKLAKTDAIDARMLALFGATLQPKVDELPSQEQLQLQSLVARREQLVASQAQQRTEAKQLGQALLVEQAQALIAFVDKQIEQLEQEILRLLNAHRSLQHKSLRLQQVQGVGATVSATLVAVLPELGQIPDPQLASLAGLAPHPWDSGPMKGQRHIRGGRKRARRVLYMAALSAIRHNPILKKFYQRLIQRGKPFKVCITAVMRKLLCLLNKLSNNPTFVLAS